jgi:hypothetical protein
MKISLLWVTAEGTGTALFFNLVSKTIDRG